MSAHSLGAGGHFTSCPAHADDGAALGEAGQDLAQKIRPCDRIELIGGFQSRGSRHVVVGTEGDHQIIAIVGAGIGCHTPGRWFDGRNRFP